MSTNEQIERKPYPNKCYLPFILYPPGMHRNMEGQDFVERHIDINEEGQDFVIYISIPFCRTRCKACPYFVSLLNERENTKEDVYIDALIKDLKKWASYKRWKKSIVRDIYIGGGTGSIIKTQNLQRIVDTVFDNFTVAEDCGITLEGNARDFTDEKIDYVVSSRISRISLGVQSFQPEILKIVGSPHAAQDSIKVIKAFQAKGFHNIQLDLMYNMPGHTLDIWKSDLSVLSELNVPHFTIYLYRIHTKTPQDLLIQKGKVQQPENPESFMVKAMYREAKRAAENMGYSMYMVDHFCKPGYENMYNHWNFKVDLDTLGVGPGSYSFFHDRRLGTESNIEKYIEQVNKGEFLISTVSDRLSERVRRERYIVFALLYYSIDFDFYFNKFGTNFLEDFSEEVRRLEKKGLIELSENSMQLTELGLIWHMNVILEFFNLIYWEDTNSLNEPNWSLNGIGVEVGAQKRSYWLGEKSQIFFDGIHSQYTYGE